MRRYEYEDEYDDEDEYEDDDEEEEEDEDEDEDDDDEYDDDEDDDDDYEPDDEEDDVYFDSWRSWPKPPSKAERIARAGRAAKKLTRGGRELRPVVAQGRTAAKSTWGKGWCTTLASYGDYENRLPRGMSYLRSGAVIDLRIARGRVDALVSGTSVYKVRIDIRPLSKSRWRAMKEKCAGGITSLVALLRGELSPPIMDVIARREGGLFPAPGEIDLACTCPDSAVMCKHAAAVLFGIGTRLDEEPELLFVLRGVDHRELITDAPVTAVKRGRRASNAAGKMASADLESVFGIELAGTPAAEPASNDVLPTSKPAKTKRKTASKRPDAARAGGQAKRAGKGGAAKRAGKAGAAKRAGKVGAAKRARKAGTAKRAGKAGTAKRTAAARSGSTAKKAATTRSVRQGRNGER